MSGGPSLSLRSLLALPLVRRVRLPLELAIVTRKGPLAGGPFLCIGGRRWMPLHSTATLDPKPLAVAYCAPCHTSARALVDYRAACAPPGRARCARVHAGRANLVLTRLLSDGVQDAIGVYQAAVTDLT
jgi:hypothetical protein